MNLHYKEMDLALFKSHIREEVIDFYNTNDNAHKIDHADMVCDEILKFTINESPIYIKLAILAAYYHDIAADQRKDHHLIAKNFILSNKLASFKWITDEQKIMVANACAEHRGSYSGAFYSPLSGLLSAADRGKPNHSLMMKRSIDFHQGDEWKIWKEAHKELTNSDLRKQFLNICILKASHHMYEKYGENGYARYTTYYKELYKEEITDLQKTIDRVIKPIIEKFNGRLPNLEELILLATDEKFMNSIPYKIS